MSVIPLRHPQHGAKVAISEQEAVADERNGWRRFNPDDLAWEAPEPDLPPLVAEQPQWANLVKLNKDGSVRQKSGRKASARVSH